MDIRQIDENMFVSAQLTLEMVDKLAQAGFKTIICNRPDNEDIGQLAFADIKEKAEKLGITAVYIPVSPPHFDKKCIDAMKQVLNTNKEPILAYCRSGARSQHLYQLAQEL